MVTANVENNVLTETLIGEYEVRQIESTTTSFNPTESSAGRGIALKPDGTKLYFADLNNAVYQYSLSTPYDVTTASYDSTSLTGLSSAANGEALDFKDDGTVLYVSGRDAVEQYNLSTAWDIGTASSNGTYDWTSEESSAQGFSMAKDGSHFAMNGFGSNNTYVYSMSTNYDVTTASLDNTATGTGNINSLNWSKYGNRLYFMTTQGLSYLETSAPYTLTGDSVDIEPAPSGPSTYRDIDIQNNDVFIGDGGDLYRVEDATGASTSYSPSAGEVWKVSIDGLNGYVKNGTYYNCNGAEILTDTDTIEAEWTAAITGYRVK